MELIFKNVKHYLPNDVYTLSIRGLKSTFSTKIENKSQEDLQKEIDEWYKTEGDSFYKQETIN